MTASPAAVVEYEAFRTGLTYSEVYHMIYSRKWKRRNGVLGKWHELKQALYAQYLADNARPEINT